MTRPATVRAAACLAAAVSIALAGVVLPSPDAARAARTDAEETPLEVSLEAMTPSTIPRRGTITLTGEVTNTSADTWTDLQAYLMISGSPITTQADLAAAAESDPAAEVGGRLTRDGLYDEIGDLEPGESTAYTVSVPRKDLDITGEPGAYWVGVHVLGAVDGVRDGVAAGRARTFMPLMTDRGPGTEVAVVVPLRDRVRRSAEGRLLGIERWQAMLGPGGRLTRLADFAAESEQPLTWLVDPAVLDAASSVAQENPPFDTKDDGSAPGEDDQADGGGQGADGSVSPSPSADSSGDGSAADPEPTPQARAAADWLTSFVDSSSRNTVLALPYGDLDVAAVTGNRLGRILRKAQTLSRRTLDGLGVGASPVVSPPSGLLPPRALAALDAETPVVLSDRAFPDTPGPLLRRPDGTEVVLLDSHTGSGGPGPNDPQDPLALRQRILADAAVHALSTDRGRPLVVSTPPYWELGGAWEGSDFFDGLAVPWLTQVDLTTVLADDTREQSTRPPAYSPRERRRQVPFANQLATQELVNVGDVYADLLTRNDSVGEQLAKSAMLASSYSARSTPAAALARARNSTLRIRRSMQLVDVDGPGFVMMSSETGPISVTVVNNLDDTVTVRLQAVPLSEGLTIKAPDPITLGPGQRAPVRLRAESTAIGVHQVTLVATTEDGRRLGSAVQFNVRSSNVGLVIWVVMGTAGALLLVMIGFRILRRVRRHRAQEGTE